MPLHDISYQHWAGIHVGIWGRRLAIARNGFTACLKNPGMRRLIGLAWVSALFITVILFGIGQLLVKDSLVTQWIGSASPLFQSLTSWLEQHPETAVRTVQNLLLYYFTIWLTGLSIFVAGLAVPSLISRDLASNAIIVYASKAVSRGDYLLGKFATVFGLLTLSWLGPACAAWLMGNLLAPDWHFFWYSRGVLWHLFVCGICTVSILSLLALGVSGIARREKSTAAFWFIWWIIGGALRPITEHSAQWPRHLSFNYNLDQIAIALFRPGNDLQTAQENIPALSEVFRKINPNVLAALDTPAIGAALVGLLLVLGASVIILARRVRPE